MREFLPQPKPEPRKRTKARAKRQQSNRTTETRIYVFARERDTCRCCRLRPADSMHELIFRSLGGKVSRWNSVAVCGSGTSGCHGYLQHLEILWEGGPLQAEETLVFIPRTKASAEYLKIPVGLRIDSQPMRETEISL